MMDRKNETSALPERLDYDNLFKTVLRSYFWEALKIFLPALYEAADKTEAPEFLEQELQKVTFDLEEGINRTDLLVRIKLKDGATELVLCHIEVQGEGGGDLPVRMYRYKQMIYLKYGEEPVGIAVATVPRPREEKSSYDWERFGVKVAYDYVNVDITKLENDEFLVEDSRVGLVLYAAKCAYLSRNDEREKFRYLRLLSSLWAERGWGRNDKRLILLAIEYLINMKDEAQIKDMVAHIESLPMKKEDKEMYISIFERVYTERGEARSRIEIAKNMLNDGLPLEKITQYTNLSREEIEAFFVHENSRSLASPQ